MRHYEEYFAQHHDRFLAEWREFLSFKSVSADPAHHQDCLACADWVAAHLKGLGFHTELWTTDTKPVVYGVLPGNKAKPTVLFYGHYDVQPVDPLHLWLSPPFEATLRGGRMYARGAQDNKGQVFYVLKALEALRALGADLPTIKVIIEGEEESSSQAMHKHLHEWREPLSADILMVCDTGMVAHGVPTVTMGLRGVLALEFRVHGPKIDLHSGLYGGVVLNPLQALTAILAGLHNADGSVAVPGFYDGVAMPSDADRARANSAPIDLKAISESLGVPLAGGEKGLAPLERRGFRPTLEINGVGGGHQGAGGKTVIPAVAMAKLSCRTVEGQEPRDVVAKVKAHIRALAPEGARVEFVEESIGGRAFKLSVDAPVVALATEASARAFNREPVFLWEGASVPIIPELAAVSGGSPIMVGFGMEEDHIHSPNESFSLRQFEEGYRYAVAFLQVV